MSRVLEDYNLTHLMYKSHGMYIKKLRSCMIMTALNNELSKRLSNLDDEYETLLRPLLNDLASANTSTEETLAKDKFKTIERIY